MDMDTSTADDYYVTALQIFDYCGAESAGTLHVDALMDKFAPFIKTNKSEYSHLKSLLDPEQENPEINVTKLAKALNKYSKSQKSKVDLDESFNLRCGPAPQDSDSGISDGYQLLEELQCELREKSHLAHQLKSQLDFTDRQHEEVLTKLTAERDLLRAHLTMLRDENTTLTHVRRDYDEACERLCNSEKSLDEARRELESNKRRNKMLAEQVSVLESEKLTLQELLAQSKEECHHINDMYASRQSNLREENETLKTKHADLSARLQDQEEFMQQIIKEKVLLEMELKDMLNKSNQTQLRMDRSIDISYSEDQILTTLDSLTADSRFSPDNRLLDEESFVNALKDDQGRATNMSLFDEIRFSFSNSSTRHNFTEANNISLFDKCRDLDISTTDICTQTYDLDMSTTDICTQTDGNENLCCDYREYYTIATQTCGSTSHAETQTISLESNNNNCIICSNKCSECEKSKQKIDKMKLELRQSQRVAKEVEIEIGCYQNNLSVLQKIVAEEKGRNVVLQTAVDSLRDKIVLLDTACANQKDIINSLSCETSFAQSQNCCDVTSVSTQAEIPCMECQKRDAVVPQRTIRRYFWEPLKCLFQIFAVVCFICAISLLYGVTRRWNARCREAVPWRWLDAQDLMDLLFRIEYVADVPIVTISKMVNLPASGNNSAKPGYGNVK